jgi:hypothetical protein
VSLSFYQTNFKFCSTGDIGLLSATYGYLALKRPPQSQRMILISGNPALDVGIGRIDDTNPSTLTSLSLLTQFVMA